MTADIKVKTCSTATLTLKRLADGRGLAVLHIKKNGRIIGKKQKTHKDYATALKYFNAVDMVKISEVSNGTKS